MWYTKFVTNTTNDYGVLWNHKKLRVGGAAKNFIMFEISFEMFICKLTGSVCTLTELSTCWQHAAAFMYTDPNDRNPFISLSFWPPFRKEVRPDCLLDSLALVIPGCNRSLTKKRPPPRKHMTRWMKIDYIFYHRSNWVCFFSYNFRKQIIWFSSGDSPSFPWWKIVYCVLLNTTTSRSSHEYFPISLFQWCTANTTDHSKEHWLRFCYLVRAFDSYVLFAQAGKVNATIDDSSRAVFSKLGCDP